MKNLKKNLKLHIALMTIALLLGAFTGGIIWLFLKAVDGGVVLLWEVLPAYTEFVGYPVIICGIGGVLIGLWRKKFGNYPEELEDVMMAVKSTSRYDSHRVYVLLVASLLPLVFGGSIGPEAGLAGVIAALCTWVGDRFKYVIKEIKRLAEISVSASLSILFSAPLFGFMAQLEQTGQTGKFDQSDGESRSFPGRTKIILYFCAILSGFGVLFALTHFLGGRFVIERLEYTALNRRNMVWIAPLALFGAGAGCLYHFIGWLARRAVSLLKSSPVICSLLGGLLLGLCGMFVPLVMFSGESQMSEIMSSASGMAPALLIALGFLKLLMVNVCIHTGWRGGHIFPIVFAGVCFGYGLAALTGVESAFAVAVIATALCGSVIGKPIAVIMVMLIFFPVNDIIVLSFAALVGAGLFIGKRVRRS